MNLTLSVPGDVAARAKRLAACEGKTLSGWFREAVATAEENAQLEEIRRLDPAVGRAVGAALPLEEHWEDKRWRALVEKHLK
jgi:hypothetical protein